MLYTGNVPDLNEWQKVNSFDFRALKYDVYARLKKNTTILNFKIILADGLKSNQGNFWLNWSCKKNYFTSNSKHYKFIQKEENREFREVIIMIIKSYCNCKNFTVKGNIPSKETYDYMGDIFLAENIFGFYQKKQNSEDYINFKIILTDGYAEKANYFLAYDISNGIIVRNNEFNKLNVPLYESIMDFIKKNILHESRGDKMKVDDNVIWNGKTRSSNEANIGFFEDMRVFLNSKKVHTIVDICGKGTCLLEDGNDLFDLTWFDLVEEPKFKVGDEVEVTNNDKFWGKYKKYNFYSYDETLDYPYLVKRVLADGKTFISSFKNCRKFKQRYRAYTEFNADWLREIIKNDDWEEWQIVGWQDGKVLLFNEVAYDNSDDDYCHKRVSLEELVKEYTKDGKPFGEEIK